MNRAKELIVYLVIIAVASAAGFLLHDQIRWPVTPKPQEESATLMPPEQALILPAEIDLVVGEPKILSAQTLGKRVQWMSLDNDLKIMPLDARSVWVVARKSGNLRATAWTAVNNLPTPIQVCICRAKDEDKKK